MPDASISDYLGVQTNNVAEYTGVVRALALAQELGAREVHLLLDSKLIVEQLAGRWRVKDPKLIPLWTACRQTLGRSSAGPRPTSRAPRTPWRTRWPTRRSTARRPAARRRSRGAPAARELTQGRLESSARRSDGRASAGRPVRREESPSSASAG